MDQLGERLQASLGTAYIVERELGGGGMSRVFVAVETRFGRRVAIKVLALDTTEGLSIQRFEREIALAAGLQQANIVPLIAAGDVDGLPWYSMPYVDGESLRDRTGRGAVPVSEVLGILGDIARALAYAHARGVVHRDIKPENVLLAGGAAVVTDFGIAKAVTASRTSAPGESRSGTLTQVGTSLGTPAYMAPEQAVGEQVDERADLYAWGVVAYELLAGRHPFAGKVTAQQLIAAHIAESPAPLSERAPMVPRGLASLVMQCLEKEASNRPRSAEALLQGIDRVRLSGGAQPPPRRSVIVYAAALGAVGLIAALLIRRAPHRIDVSVNAGGAQTPTLAVLPFANIGGDSASEYFSDGMTDELTVALSQGLPLRVAARTSAFSFKGSHKDIHEIGRQLGVDHIVEGAVQRASGRLRVFVRLENTSTGGTEWSQRYERRLTDVFAVQDEIARSIVGTLRIKLSGNGPRLSEPATTDVEAHDLYLKGQFFANKGDEPSVRRALGYYRQALDRDPGYAPAWVGIAEAYGWMSDEFLAPDASFPKAKAAAERALALDSTLASAWAMLGNVRIPYERNLGAGREALQRAFALRPDGGTGFVGLSGYYMATGHPDSAIALLRRVEVLDPLNPVLKGWTAWIENMAGAHDDAIAEARAALELDPDNPYAYLPLGEALQAQGDLQGAAEAFQRGMGLGNRALAGLAGVYAAQGKRARVIALRDSLLTLAHHRYVGADVLASVYAALGDRDRAFALLEESARQGGGQLIVAGWDPRWKPLRDDPRWGAYLRRIGVRNVIPPAAATRAATSAPSATI